LKRKCFFQEAPYIQQKEERATGLVTSCVGIAFENTLLKDEKKRKKTYAATG